jgi:hypothetical protein
MGAAEGRRASAIRLSARMIRGRWQLDAGVTEYQKERGGPVLVIYEPHAENAFPLVQLVGLGRRYHSRIRLRARRIQLDVMVARRISRPQNALETGSIEHDVELSLLRRF